MYFPDLAIYSYEVELPEVQTVGWLELGQPFMRGSVTEPLLASLRAAVRRCSARGTRGLHTCEFCDAEEIWCEDVRLGAAELWIRSPGGQIYAAPDLIVHYVEAHAYRPPEPFLEALAAPVGQDWRPEDVADALIRRSLDADRRSRPRARS